MPPEGCAGQDGWRPRCSISDMTTSVSLGLRHSTLQRRHPRRPKATSACEQQWLGAWDSSSVSGGGVVALCLSKGRVLTVQNACLRQAPGRPRPRRRDDNDTRRHPGARRCSLGSRAGALLLLLPLGARLSAKLPICPPCCLRCSRADSLRRSPLCLRPRGGRRSLAAARGAASCSSTQAAKHSGRGRAWTSPGQHG